MTIHNAQELKEFLIQHPGITLPELKKVFGPSLNIRRISKYIGESCYILVRPETNVVGRACNHLYVRAYTETELEERQSLYRPENIFYK